MEKKETETIYRTAKMWQIRVYPLAGGVNNMFYMLMMYISYLAVGGYGILTATVGVILTATRIFDGITDPIVAFFAEKLSLRNGRIRILLWGGWGVMVIGLLLMFFLGVGHSPIIFVITYLIYILGYTMFGVGQQSANPVITNDPKQRPLLAKWTSLYSMIFMMGTSMFFMAVLLPKFDNEYSVPMMQSALLCVIAATAVLLALSTFAIAPVDKAENFNVGKREKAVGFKEMVHMIKENRALQMFVIAATSDKLALNIAGNTAFQTLVFGVLIGNMGMSAVMSGLTMPITLLGAIFASMMAVRKGNKYSLVFWTWFATIVSGVSVIVYIFLDFGSVFKAAVPTVLFLGLTIIKSLGQNGCTAMTNAVLADVTDYEAYRSGNFMPSAVAATYSFIDKFISAFATTIAGAALAIAGWSTTMPQPTDERTPIVLPMVIIMTLIVPMIGWGCTLVAMKWYPLTKEKMVDIQTKLHEMREAAKEGK